MNAPTAIFIAVILLIILEVVYLCCKMAIIFNSRTDEQNSSNAYFYGERERWHKEQGHKKISMTVIDMKMGRFGYRWEDMHGNDVTYRSQY